MFRHKFVWLTLIMGLLILSGCSSSSSDGPAPTPDKNETALTCEEQGLVTAEDGTCQEPVVEKTCEEQGLITYEGECKTQVEINKINCDANESAVWNSETESCEAKPVVTKTLKSLYFQGVAIDGYVKEGNATLFNRVTEEAVGSILTGKKGGWNFEVPGVEENEDVSNYIVSVKNGIDIATGNPFEGTLSNIIEPDDIDIVSYKEDETPVAPTTTKKVVVTPLTTIVTETIKSKEGKGETISKSDAEEQVATSLGVTTRALKADPVELLESNDTSEEKLVEKNEAADAIKKALVIQKVAESLSKSVADEDETVEGATKFEDVFSAVLSSVAEKIQEKADKGKSVNFETVLEEEGDAFAEQVALKTKEKDLTSTELSNEEKKAKFTAFAKMLVKLKAATRVTKKVVSVIEKIDKTKLTEKSETGVSQIEVISKATEVVTKTLEDRVKEIAKSEVEVNDEWVTGLTDGLLDDNGRVNALGYEDLTNPALDTAVASAEKVINAVVAMGGIETISKEVEKVVVEAEKTKTEAETNPDFDPEAEEVDVTVNLDSLNTILEDNDTIEKYSAIYTQYEELGVSTNDIIDSTIEANENNTSVIDVIVTKTEINISEEDKATINTAVTEAKDTFTAVAETAVASTKESIVTTVVVKTAPIVSLSGKTSAKVGETISFSAGVTNSADMTTAISYSWSGDVSGSTSSVSHSFSEAGTYTVTVSITANGQTVSKSLTVVISALTCEDQGLITHEGECKTQLQIDEIECLDDDTKVWNGTSCEDKPVTETAPIVTLTSNLSSAYTGTNITFTAGSDIAGTTYSWKVGTTVQSSTSSTLSYTFTTAGTYTVSVTGTASGLSSSASKTVTITNRPVTQTDTSDELTLKSNQVTFGKNSYAKTVTAVNGFYGTVKYEPLNSVSNSEKADIFSLSLSVENANFEGGEEENISVVMYIGNEDNDQVLEAIVPNIKLKYSGGLFTLDTTDATTLYGYGIKENGTPVSTEITDINFSKYLTLNSNKLELSYYDVMKMITNKVGWTSNIIDTYFQKGGNYLVSFGISGVDKFNGMRYLEESQIADKFSTDQRTLILAKLPIKELYDVSGYINITQIGEIADKSFKIASESSETQTYDVSSYFSTTNGTSAYSLDCNPTNGYITIDNSGIITVNTENSGDYECNVTFSGNEVDEVSDNFTITVIDNATPTFENNISTQNFMINIEITDIDVTSHFSDAENDTLTYSLGCSVAGLEINSTTGIISGTPTSNTTGTTCSVSAIDTYSQSVSSNDFTVVVSNLPAPVIASLTSNPNPAEGNTSDEFTFIVDASVQSVTGGDSDVTYKWFVNDVEQNSETTDTFIHTFIQSISTNTYVVKAEVSANGQTDTETIDVTISNNTPEASLITAPTSCEVNQTCSFVGTASDKDSGDVSTLKYIWEINGTDQENDNTLTFDHTFTEAGTYTVTFIAYDNGGSEKSIDVNVTVSEPVPNLYNIVESHDLSSDWNGYKLASSLTGSFSSTLLSLGSSNSSVSTDPVQGTDTTTIYLVETAGDQDNFIEFKFDNSSYTTGNIIYIKLGTKTTTITVGDVSNEDEIVLQ